MTFKYKVNLFFIIILVIILNSIIVYGDNTISENNIDNLDYNKVLHLISKLENAAEEYINSDNENYNALGYDKDMLVYTYIRGVRYNSSSWNTLAGERDIEFDNFIKLNYPDVISLRSINNLVVPTGDEIDFIHMVASINMYNNGYGVLGSWGGDLSSIIIDLCSEEDDYDKLYIKASSLINSINSNFNIYDMNSDLDANNIYLIMKENSISLSEAMMMYYSDVDSNSDRVRKFVDSKYMLEDFTNGNLRNCYLTEFTNDIFSDVYLSTKGVDMYERPVLIEACSNAFADYLYESYPDIGIESIEFIDSDDIYLFLSSDFSILNYNVKPKYNIKNKLISFKYDNSVLDLDGSIIKPVSKGVSSIIVYDELNSNVYDLITVHILDEQIDSGISDNSIDNQNVGFVPYKSNNDDIDYNYDKLDDLKEGIEYEKLCNIDIVELDSEDYEYGTKYSSDKNMEYNNENIKEASNNIDNLDKDEEKEEEIEAVVEIERLSCINNKENYNNEDSKKNNKYIDYTIKALFVCVVLFISICVLICII